MENKGHIVITTIFPPSEAIARYAAMKDHRTVVVGDRRTPVDWACPGTRFLSLAEQRRMFPAFDAALPVDHYSRKMMGYLYALREEAKCVVDTDDDNVPKERWGFPPTEGQYETIVAPSGFFNVYRLFTDQRVWPRGFPLSHLSASFDGPPGDLARDGARVGLWQGLADGEPDVDAVYRLTNDRPVYFQEREPVVLAPGIITPLNTQNSLIVRELFPLLYLPVTVSFRFTDILRGLVAQPILWRYGYRVGFVGATVTQKRNPHDYLQDFASEIPMYLHAARIVELVLVALGESATSLTEDLRSAYRALSDDGIVRSAELDTLESWLREF